MAEHDVQYYIDQINTAVRGEDVRNAIIELLKMANQGGSNASTLHGHTWDFFAKQTDMDLVYPSDAEPTEHSTKPVQSGTLYTYLNTNIIDAINKILYGTAPGTPPEGTISSKIKDVATVRKLIQNAIMAQNVQAKSDDSFESFAQKIRSIQSEQNFEIISLPTVHENGTYQPDAIDQAYRVVEVDVQPNTAKKTITAPGTYKAKDDDKDLDGYSEVTVELSTGGSGSESAALVSKSIDLSNLPAPGSSSLSKTFHPKDDGAKAVGYSEVSVNLNGLVAEKTIEYDGSEEMTVTAATEDNVHGYSKVIIKYVQSDGPFTVEFWNGDNKWDTVTVQHAGESARPSESKGNPPPPNDTQMFVGWSPQPYDVRGNMKCYAQFEDVREASFEDEIEETWEEIGQTGGANVKIGEYKTLYWKSFPYNGATIPAGHCLMVKVDSEEDGPDGKTTSTWLSYHPSNDSTIPGPVVPYLDTRDVDYTNFKAWGQSDLRECLQNAFRNAISQCTDMLIYGGAGKIATYMKPVYKYTYSRFLEDGDLIPNTDSQSADVIWLPSVREVEHVSTDRTDHETRGKVYDFQRIYDRTDHRINFTTMAFWTRSSDMALRYPTTQELVYEDMQQFKDKIVGKSIVFKRANTREIYQQNMSMARYNSAYVTARVAHGFQDHPQSRNEDVAQNFTFGFCT